MAMGQHVTTNEATEVLGVTAEAVRRYARDGRFGVHL